MEFIFSCSTRHITSSLRSLVSYRVKHSIHHTKRNSISTRVHVLFSIYHIHTMVLTEKGNLSCKQPKSACDKSSSCRVSFSASRCYYQSPWIRNFRFSFHISSRKVWTILSVNDPGFLVFKLPQSEKMDKQPWIEVFEGFVVHSSTWLSGAKGELRVKNWLAI